MMSTDPASESVNRPGRKWFSRARKLTFRLAVGIFTILVAGIVLDAATYDSQAWQADYRHLKSEMARRYANLDWCISHRKLDVQKLDAETTEALQNSRTRLQAIRRFISAFRDPHLKLVADDGESENPVRHSDDEASVAASVSEPACRSCDDGGFEEGDHRFQLPFDELPGWKLIRQGNFPTGLLSDLGVLRIASFGEDQYRSVCQKQFAPGMTARELQLATRVALQTELIDCLQELRSSGATRLAVDITGNGGGTEWVAEVVSLFSERTLVRRDSRMVKSSPPDRSGVWRGEAVESVLNPEGELVHLQGTGKWNGPVIVIIDNGTGSASEDFAAWLHENEIATLIGQRTAGAGGGYVNGGGRIHLKTAPFDVMAPNCARFLKNGTNEIEGLTPDFYTRPDDAKALADTLQKVLQADNAPRDQSRNGETTLPE